MDSITFDSHVQEKLRNAIKTLKKTKSPTPQGQDLFDGIQPRLPKTREEDEQLSIASRPKRDIIAMRKDNEDASTRDENQEPDQIEHSDDEVKGHEMEQSHSTCGVKGLRGSHSRGSPSGHLDNTPSWTDYIHDLAAYLSTHYPLFTAKDISDRAKPEKLPGQVFFEETAEFSNLLSDFDEDLKDSVKNILVFNLKDMPRTSRDLWSTSEVQLPHLTASGYPSGRCWKSEYPNETSLLLATMSSLKAQVSSRTQVYRRGETDKTTDSEVALAQMAYEDRSNPVWLTGLYLKALTDGAFRPSVAIDKRVESFDITNQQLLLTPKYTFTNLHIGKVLLPNSLSSADCHR
jgi:hypothetical protein